MISEVVPAPKVYMFFALFNTVSKTSGFLGPLISAAIVRRAGGNTNYAFWFLSPMGICGIIVLYFVDTDTGGCHKVGTRVDGGNLGYLRLPGSLAR